MSVNRINISDKLIEGYVKAPPSLQEQAITKLAIQLCQNVELKNVIIFESEPLRKNKFTTSNIKWDALVDKRSTVICMRLPLTPNFKKLLIVRMRLIALQLFNWNRQQAKFNLSPGFADSLLTPSDWTIEMRLDEKKIAQRLVQDRRIPVSERYKIACFYCIESYIHLLWNHISNQDLFCRDGCALVRIWSYQLSGRAEEILVVNLLWTIGNLRARVGELITREDQFWFILLMHGITEGSRSTVLYCWDKMRTVLRQVASIDAAVQAVVGLRNLKRRRDITGDFIMYFDSSLLPIFFTDILCFMLTQMSKEQSVELYRTIQNLGINALVFFLQWPCLDLLIPFIKELWNILPMAIYRDILLTIANHYSDEIGYNNRRNEYVDSEYGVLMMELLKETPNDFKRYVFSDSYRRDDNPIKAGESIYSVINKNPLKFRNIRIFQNIWQHVTLEEKQVFLRSEYGESFCCHLALEENWEILNSVLRECLAEEDISEFKKKVFISKSGKETCFEMLTQVNEDGLISWLNWGFPSEPEIFQYILKIFFKDQRIDFKEVSDFEWTIEIDCLDNVIKCCAPSVDARNKFKSRFVRIYSKNMCINFVIHSKWKEVDQYLSWGFPSENTRTRFKKWFVREYAGYVCEYHLARLNLQDAEQFLTWCFPTKEAIEQFRQELFVSSGLNLPWVLLSRNSQDLDSLVKWFGLTPEATVKFKRQVLFCSNSLSAIFDPLTVLEHNIVILESVAEMLQRVSNFLRWGLTDEKTVMDFKDKSNEHIMGLPFINIRVRQLVQKKWNTLINEILSSLPVDRTRQDLVKLIFVSIAVGCVFAVTNHRISNVDKPEPKDLRLLKSFCAKSGKLLLSVKIAKEVFKIAKSILK